METYESPPAFDEDLTDRDHIIYLELMIDGPLALEDFVGDLPVPPSSPSTRTDALSTEGG